MITYHILPWVWLLIHAKIFSQRDPRVDNNWSSIQVMACWQLLSRPKNWNHDDHVHWRIHASCMRHLIYVYVQHFNLSMNLLYATLISPWLDTSSISRFQRRVGACTKCVTFVTSNVTSATTIGLAINVTLKTRNVFVGHLGSMYHRQ